MADLTYDSQEAVPEDLRGDAKEVNGKWTVSVVSNTKLKEFRDNNISLAKERDTLKDALGAFKKAGDDPAALVAELTELRGVHQQVKDGKLKGSEAITAEVEARVKQSRESYETQLREAGQKVQAAEAKAAALDSKFKGSIMERAITGAVMAEDSGINPAALPDILSRARSVFSVTDDDKLVPKEGDTVIYGADGVSPMSPKEWLGKVLEVAPYLGKQSAGGGANGGGERKGGTHGMSQDEWDKLSGTRQIELARQNSKR